MKQYFYLKKVVQSGNNLELYQYTKRIPIPRETPPRKAKKPLRAPYQPTLFNPQTPDMVNRQISARSLFRTRTNLRRLVNSNPQLDKLMTLTYNIQLTDIKTSNKYFDQFIKRMMRYNSKFQYIAVPEYQPTSGRLHYHLICSLPYTPNRIIRKLWKKGYVNLKHVKQKENLGIYLTKYLTKEKIKPEYFRKKKYICSQSLLRPIIYYNHYASQLLSAKLLSLKSVLYRIFSNEYTGTVEYSAFISDPLADQQKKPPNWEASLVT